MITEPRYISASDEVIEHALRQHACPQGRHAHFCSCYGLSELLCDWCHAVLMIVCDGECSCTYETAEMPAGRWPVLSNLTSCDPGSSCP